MISRAAVLIVDMQRDFLAHPALEPDADTLSARIADLAGWARESGHPVVHVHTLAAADGSNWMPHWKQSGRAYCIEGTPGAEPSENLRPAPGEAVFSKQYYSGFQDPAAARELREKGIDTLIVAGVHTHACVRATVSDAYALGFGVLIPEEAVGSYDPEHAALSLEWLGSRAARCLPIASIKAMFEPADRPEPVQVWPHRAPTDWTDVIGEVPLTPPGDVHACASRLDGRQPDWARTPVEMRAQALQQWHGILLAEREGWVQALIRDVGKPRIDAEGEIAYALALLDNVCRTLADSEQGASCEVKYRPLGTVGIITPWNNPFAMPVSKIAPALGYGNGVVWKPALPGSAIARKLLESLDQAGLGQWLELVTGDAATGRAIVEAPDLAAISFTGSVEVGQDIIRRCGELMRPIQAELGGNNAAIVRADADLERAAGDLAGAMFSYAGQRCTAIRRVIVERAIAPEFTRLFLSAVEDLKVGQPADPATQVGPVISRAQQQMLLDRVSQAAASGGQILAGGAAPAHCPGEGCWVMPTVIAGLAADSPIVTEELFGPVVALTTCDDFEDGLRQHNGVSQGLLGTLYSRDREARSRFLAEAQAGILLFNRARPDFSPEGPFFGWKESGHGPAEHGRWNRDFYTRVQAVYADD